eukprot:scaffold9249_cov86-Skeletonema_dohrnii-CCMP3373.AAC.5
MLSTAAAARLSSSLLVCPLLESPILSRRIVVPRNWNKSYASSINSSSLDSSAAADQPSASESEEEHSPLQMCSKLLKVDRSMVAI